MNGHEAGLWAVAALTAIAAACLLSAAVDMRRETVSWVTVLAFGGGLLVAVWAVAGWAWWLTGGAVT